MASSKRAVTPRLISPRKEEKLPYKKVTQAFLRSITKDPLGSITFLDLSRCDIKRVTGISACGNLEVLILHGNCIDTLVDVSVCPHLWKLDVSCNELKDLSGFERFKTFGTLIVTGNQLSWIELSKIAHLEILSLYLMGNRKLKSDVNYRKHVIKSLPKIWSLDGELVTSKERRKVENFFQKTAKSDKPVRLKISSHQFVPTFMKNDSVLNVFGRRTILASKYFGKNEVHNFALDKRRLQHLGNNLNDDSALESCQEINIDSISCVLPLQEKGPEKWNVFLVLLISSLVFAIPKELLISVLQVIGMTEEEDTICFDILNLPLQMRTNVVSLLFSTLKLNGLGKEVTVELYDTLRVVNQALVEVAFGDSDVKIHSKYHHVIASEVVLVFCLVPNFSMFLHDPSIIDILICATLSANIEDEIREHLCKCDALKYKERLVELITMKIGKAKRSSQHLFSNLSNHPLDRNSIEIKGRSCTSTQLRPATAPPLKSGDKVPKSHPKPAVGDKVMLSPQRLAHIVSIPDSKLVLVQVDSLPSPRYLQADYLEPNDNVQSLFYINKTDLSWNQVFASWVTDNAAFQRLSDSRKSGYYNRRQGLLLQRVLETPKQRSKSASKQHSVNTIGDFPQREERSTQAGFKNPESDAKNESTAELYDLRHANTPVPPELQDEEHSTECKILQSNVYHFYPLEQKASQMPKITLSPRSKTSNFRKPDSMFIRKSNWVNSFY